MPPWCFTRAYGTSRFMPATRRVTVRSRTLRPPGPIDSQAGPMCETSNSVTALRVASCSATIEPYWTAFPSRQIDQPAAGRCVPGVERRMARCDVMRWKLLLACALLVGEKRNDPRPLRRPKISRRHSKVTNAKSRQSKPAAHLSQGPARPTRASRQSVEPVL